MCARLSGCHVSENKAVSYYYYRRALAVAEAMGSRAITGGSCANVTNIGSNQLLGFLAPSNWRR
jgi:hypothetical protein